MERWRDECQRALARANPDGSDDHLVALILGSYFNAMAGAVSGIADPQAQDRLCQAEARRFLAVLRRVPDRRQRMAYERAERLRQDGLVVFPTPPEEGEAP
jgi:hypothetical protein